MPRGNPKGTNRGGGRRKTGNAGTRLDWYCAPDLIEAVKIQPNRSQFVNEAIRRLVEDRMNKTITYPELEQEMLWKGFTREEVDILTNWWPNDWEWLKTASAEEIREASTDALTKE